jgi:soluble lytic murein transglycosylase-like protein
MTNRTTAILALLAAAAVLAPAARADYAVLRSGVRLHVTGYERDGDRVRLTLEGGSVEIAADDLASVEPEDVFLPVPVVAVPDAPFEKLIRDAAARNGLDEKLITHVIAVESNFDPKAVSRKQALGLMQLLPSTAARYSVANAFDPAQNIEAGAHYLKDLLARYKGNLTLALAAYNAGPDMVDKYGGVPPFAETLNYVRLITSKLAADAQAPPAN